MSVTTAVQCDLIVTKTMPTVVTEEDQEESPGAAVELGTTTTDVALTPSQGNAIDITV